MRRRGEPKARRSRLRVWLSWLLGLAVLAAVTVLVLSGSLLAALRHDDTGRVRQQVTAAIQQVIDPNTVFDGRERLNVLLIGEDRSLTRHRQVLHDHSRSDTNILVSLNRVTGQAVVLSLPRDTRVRIPGFGSEKLNAAHRFGGPPLLIETIEQNFGVPIHHYVKIRLNGFEQVVDLAGGLEIDVEHDMDYDDNWGDLHIKLQKGRQQLNGEQVHGYVRWRKNNDGTADPKGDLGRTERQQKVIKLLAAKLLSKEMLPRLPEVVATARSLVDTDLTAGDLRSLLMFVAGINPDTIGAHTLPVDDRAQAVTVAREKALALLGVLFGSSFDASALLGTEDLDQVPQFARHLLPDPQPSRLRELDCRRQPWEERGRDLGDDSDPVTPTAEVEQSSAAADGDLS